MPPRRFEKAAELLEFVGARSAAAGLARGEAARELPRRGAGTGFDALLTISNEIPPTAGQHPTTLDKRKLKKVALRHCDPGPPVGGVVTRRGVRHRATYAQGAKGRVTPAVRR